YLVAVNAIAFTYAAFQAIDLTYHLILAYLLISSSSSAATRIEDWVLNWGKDDFTKKASASIAMSFLAFLGFAFSSLISGYNLCDQSPI
ncbi:CASP-like protein 4A3, partial [Tanacetum coccineum]